MEEKIRDKEFKSFVCEANRDVNTKLMKKGMYKITLNENIDYSIPLYFIITDENVVKLNNVWYNINIKTDPNTNEIILNSDTTQIVGLYYIA